MKKTIFLLITLLSTAIEAATLNIDGCSYQGDVVNGKAHGKGVLTCPDGRQYTGDFQHGLFHGKGQYLAPSEQIVFLSPFGLRSSQVKGMMLLGRFEKGMAKGVFKVYQDGKYVFNMTFEKGLLSNMTVAK